MILDKRSTRSTFADVARGNELKAQTIRANWSSTAVRAIGRTVDRSAENIAEWSKYLPMDCIEMMVSRGWDRTT